MVSWDIERQGWEERFADRPSAVLLTRSFRYSTVVSVLSKVFKAHSAEAEMSIKSRLKYFQKKGFAPPSRGAGREINYTFYDVMDWALALTLSKLGVPTRFVISQLGYGAYKRKVERKALSGECYIFYFPSLVLDFLPEDADPLIWDVISRGKDLTAFYESIQEMRGQGKACDYCISDITHLLKSVIRLLEAAEYLETKITKIE